MWFSSVHDRVPILSVWSAVRPIRNSSQSSLDNIAHFLRIGKYIPHYTADRTKYRRSKGKRYGLPKYIGIQHYKNNSVPQLRSGTLSISFYEVMTRSMNRSLSSSSTRASSSHRS